MKNHYLDNAIMYEIYPTSFSDGNGDGIGDLKGMISKLDYLEEMGINLIWVNPLYESPWKDGGYDVTDYYRVDGRIGTNEELWEFVEQAKKRGIRVLLDLVIGHSSDKCEWFLQSQKAERNKYSDYYIWIPGLYTAMDSKTRNMVGVTEREAAYVVNFFATQPALNFGYKKIREDWQMSYKDDRLKPLFDEIINVIRFYLSRGVAGFRVDMAQSIVKNDDGRHSGTCEKWREIFAEVRREYPDSIFISEWGEAEKAINGADFNADFVLPFHGTAHDMLFRAEDNISRSGKHLRSYIGGDGLGDAYAFLGDFLRDYKKVNGKGTLAMGTGNHDFLRYSANKTEDEKKLCFAFLYALPLVPMTYYGDEIGIPQQNLKNRYGGYYRTGARCPMQWNGGKNGGFSDYDGELYLPVSDTFREINVEKQEKDENSLLNFVKKLNAFKNSTDLLSTEAKFEVVFSGRRGYPLVIGRKNGGSALYAYFNPSDKEYRIRNYGGEAKIGFNFVHGDTEIVLKKHSFAYYVREKR